MIVNPVLKGFNPDPSILRVGNDYYIATSTFEWFPGVAIYHSRDLVHWRLLTHAFTRTSQLDLRGVPSSGGVWAPCLSYDNGTFYLIYTNVVGRLGVYKETHNYLVTATDIMGPWSEPVYLNSSGFDPSLFHDTDGRKWLVNMRWDFRKGHNRFSGILLQEYSPSERKLVGPVKRIFSGTRIGVTESPHLYKRGGFYYLMVAEGGTGYDHAVTMARSLSLEGPYAVDPDNPMMTTVHAPEHPLQKAGHACLVETQTGEWYISHLCSRPLPSRLNPLGRETALQKVRWTEDGWLRLDHGGILPAVMVPAPALPPQPCEPEPELHEFAGDRIPISFSTLRSPADESWVSLKERPGYLRLRGRESLNSWHSQSMVARRIQHYHCEAETCVEFQPATFQQMAGLVCYYDEQDHYYLCISHDEQLGKHISIIVSDRGQYDEIGHVVSAEGWERCYLKVAIAFDKLQFSCSADGVNWRSVGPELDFGNLSDEYHNKLGFTGSFVGMCAQDLSGVRQPADFAYFRYKPLED